MRPSASSRYRTRLDRAPGSGRRISRIRGAGIPSSWNARLLPATDPERLIDGGDGTIVSSQRGQAMTRCLVPLSDHLAFASQRKFNRTNSATDPAPSFPITRPR